MRRRQFLVVAGLVALVVAIALRDGETVEAAPETVERKPTERTSRARPPRLHARPSVPSSTGRPSPDSVDEPAVDAQDDTGSLVGAVNVDLEIVWPDGAMLDDTVLLIGRDCPVGARVTDGNGELSVSRQWSACALQARMNDGLLWRRTEWVEVDLDGDDSQLVQLVMPDERTGGLGVAIAEVDDGIVVRRVYPGTPAYELGLQAGDVIIEVDGLPTTALELDEFIDIATGPEGSEVELVVAYEADTGASEDFLSVPRSFLPSSLLGNGHGGHGGHGFHSLGTVDEP